MNRDEVRQLFRTVLAMLEQPSRPNPIGERDRDPEEELAHAESYEETAAVLTRRAARKRRTAAQLREGSDELAAAGESRRGDATAAELEQQADDEERRAADYAERARIVREGAPMPRRLRTPAESLDVVDGYRHVLAEIVASLESFDDLGVEELGGFCAAAKLDNTAEALREGLALARVWALQSCKRLGVTFDEQRVHFAPFRSPLTGAPLPPGVAEITLEGDPPNENGV